MDSDPLRHLEFFSVPNNQTTNPVDQSFTLGASSTTQPPSIWDTAAALGVDVALSRPPSLAPTALSLDSLGQTPSTGFSSISPLAPSLSQQSFYFGQPRPALPMRAPRMREGHERKRSRMGTDPAPFESADYWIQFDNDESFSSVPESAEPPRPDLKGKGRDASATQRLGRRASAADPPQTTISAGRTGTNKTEDFVDDSALDKALSDEEEGFSSMNLADHLSRIDTAPPSDIPPREGLYSTPLSWERPQPGLRMDSLIGLNNSALNDAEQRRLIAIAMNPGPSMGGLGSNINLNFGDLNPGFNPTFGQGFGSMSQDPDPVSPPKYAAGQSRPPPPNAPRRQGSTSERQGSMSERQGSISDKGKEKSKLGDRTAHNDIERKYRTNLKDKIAELRDAVPALQTISENVGEDDASHPSRTPKVSKGTVLTKATEYIHQLERKNKQIMQEHRKLSQRLQAFEQLLSATARPAYTMPTYSRTLFDPRGFC
ncbi:helix-loop-helix DNA-binding domain-containing protein [Lasiosphaeris hirsuta]|uniref:Helix-loop-helix DNA-binding domain-containing protein n=1 Tax=Lasiosphaeris hirsuta TaxID=260670 RepID=A0AA40DQE9_9PEZI|nr:helix-loop-helix DNA-binding domain-containing protein [Lasiosphaeris hirsuta]